MATGKLEARMRDGSVRTIERFEEVDLIALEERLADDYLMLKLSMGNEGGMCYLSKRQIVTIDFYPDDEA